MTFEKSVLPLGVGRVSAARALIDGTAEFLCDIGGGTVIKKVDLASRAVKTSGTVSFAAGLCCFCGDGLLERRNGEFVYREDKK